MRGVADIAGVSQEREIPERRTRDSRHYRNPDGTARAVIGRGMHYGEDLREVDLTFRETEEGWIADRSPLVCRVYRKGRGRGRWWISVTEPVAGAAEDDSQRGSPGRGNPGGPPGQRDADAASSARGIEFFLPGEPEVWENRLRYSTDALTWEYVFTRTGLKLSATVESPLGSHDYRFPAQRLNAREFEVDEEGNLVSDALTIPRAVVVGADGEEYECGAWWVERGHVCFYWDDSGLPSSAYPYTLDPTTTFEIEEGPDDGAVRRRDAMFEGPGTDLIVGASSVVTQKHFPSGDYITLNGLLRWDTSSIPATSTVTRAELRIRPDLLCDSDGRSFVGDYHSWVPELEDFALLPSETAFNARSIRNMTEGALESFPLREPDANISREGYTSLRLHITGGEPSGNNAVRFHAFESGGDTALLVVDYEDGRTEEYRGDEGYVLRGGPTYPPAASFDTGSFGVCIRRFVNGEYAISNMLLRFDTSALPENAKVTEASVRLRPSRVRNADARNVTADYHDWRGLEAYSEDAKHGAIDPVPLSEITEGGDHDFPLLSPETYVKHHGTTGVRFHMDGGEPTGQNRLEAASGDLSPRLYVTYEAGGIRYSREFAALSEASATQPRSIPRGLSTEAAGDALMRRSTRKALHATALTEAALGRLYRRLLQTTATATAGLIAGRVRLQRLGATCEGAASLTLTRRYRRTLSARGEATPTRRRDLSRTLEAGAEGRASRRRALTHDLWAFSEAVARTRKTVRKRLHEVGSHRVAIDRDGSITFFVPRALSLVTATLFKRVTRLRDVARDRKRHIARTLAGIYGPVQMRYRMFVSNRRGEEVAELADWETGEVDLSNNRSASWALSLSMRRTQRIDPLVDYVLAACDLRVQPEGDWERFPLGLYRFDLPSYEYLEGVELWELGGSSPEMLLEDSGPQGEYAVREGTGVLRAVRDIIADRGWPASTVNFPPASEDRDLLNDMAFDPTSESGGSSWLNICNALLGARSFAALRTDRHGKWWTRRLSDLNDGEPDVVYADAWAPEGERLLIGDPTSDYTDNRFANVVIVRSQDVDQEPPIIAVARNDNPDSPASVQNLDRVVTKEVNLQSISSQEDAEITARAELQAATSFYRRVSISTLPDPRRTIRESYEVYADSGGNRVLNGERYGVTNWRLPMGEEVSQMTHEVNRIVPFNRPIGV